MLQKPFRVCAPQRLISAATAALSCNRKSCLLTHIPRAPHDSHVGYPGNTRVVLEILMRNEGQNLFCDRGIANDFDPRVSPGNIIAAGAARSNSLNFLKRATG